MNLSFQRPLRNGFLAMIAATIGLLISPAADIPVMSSQAKAENILDVFKPRATRKKTVRTRRAAPRKQSQRPRRASPITSAASPTQMPGTIPIPQPRPSPEEEKQPTANELKAEQPRSEPKEPAPTAAPREEPEDKKRKDATPQSQPPVPAAPPAKPDEAEPHDEKDAGTQDKRIYQSACPALMNGEVQGTLIAPLSEGMCGERSPLSLAAIGKENPLRFIAPITTNCSMAVTLAQWAKEVRIAALKSFNAEIEAIGTGSDYQCRKVNGGSAGRTSEHAFANALDIMSFSFRNGLKTELATGWNGTPEEKEFWRAIHKTSCDMFMTVIGPDGDAAHKTNLHLDQGCHGGSCTSRICQ
ncbi:extensin [Phyllobacterium salinisoli]|uniref:Extensin n=1 Tax=Phyllobacterium salinisoli TaxID=1899321 RepID=A0A368K8M5_9HYPH|nr:extensin family protein [Phyllobacterium salinisoli]RCS24420.1 extensin [Phyllobacterium salinisoli]